MISHDGLDWLAVIGYVSFALLIVWRVCGKG